MRRTNTRKKLSIWDPDDPDNVWQTTRFMVKDETMGAMRLGFAKTRADWEGWMPNAYGGVHDWKVVLTRENEHFEGRIREVETTVSYVYLTVMVNHI